MACASAKYGFAKYGESKYGEDCYSNYLTSVTVITLPKGADLYDDAYKEVVANWEYKKLVTYRRYFFDEDNNTGALLKNNYSEYDIYAEVQIVDTHRNHTRMGHLQVSDAILYMPRELKEARTGLLIDNTFRPQLNDEVTEEGITYRIKAIQALYMGDSEIAFECALTRIDNANDKFWS